MLTVLLWPQHCTSTCTCTVKSIYRESFYRELGTYLRLIHNMMLTQLLIYTCDRRKGTLCKFCIIHVHVNSCSVIILRTSLYYKWDFPVTSYRRTPFDCTCTCTYIYMYMHIIMHMYTHMTHVQVHV